MLKKMAERDFRPIFVVGNSRSGTTMVGRLLGRHPEVFTFHELHFFEQLWCPGDENRCLPRDEAAYLGALLINRQRDGFWERKKPGLYLQEARAMVDSVGNEMLTSACVFERFLLYEAKRNEKMIPCDHMPRNVYYIGEILRLFPEARVVNMVRDPRDVLLSQKNKWKRRFLGGGNIPLREACRSWINYHSITISRLWKASIDAAEQFISEDRVVTLQFEDLLSDPVKKIRDICSFLEISFDMELLEIPRIGSSRVADRPGRTGISAEMASNWQKTKGLHPTEIHWCQRINGATMVRYGYPLAQVSPGILYLCSSLVVFPFKLALAFVVNLGRMRNVLSALKKRLS